MGKVRAHIFVSGRVQGVFFRLKTKELAESFSVTGWIRNLADGRVEAVFEGDDKAVKELVEYCQHGPSSAKVTGINVAWEDYLGEFSDFAAK